MKRALCTFAVGEHEQLLPFSLPPMTEYAERHGYELRTSAPRLMTRPPAWYKVVVVLDALDDGCDEVLWVDADVLMLDTSHDISDDVWPDAWQGLTEHRTREGVQASIGVWLVRPELRKTLLKQWSLDKYRHHRWWEQAAMLDLLGYTPDELPVRLARPTPLYAHTQFVDAKEWNALWLQHPDDISNDLTGTRFVHVGPGSNIAWRVDAMRNLAQTHRAAPTR